MQIYTSIAGAYPRVGENSVGHELRNARHKYDRGSADKAEIEQLENELVLEIVREQQRAGMDLLTDGLVRWYCPISHIAGRMAGVEIGELHHYFHTNFHVRKAIVKDLPRWKEPLIRKEIEFLKSISKNNCLAVLPSPKLLIQYTENRSSFSLPEIRDAYSQALEQEAGNIGAPTYWEGGRNDFRVIEAVNAFSAKEEDPEEVAKNIKKKLRRRGSKPILLKPNWWLDIMPRRYAYRKMEILSEIKELLLKWI